MAPSAAAPPVGRESELAQLEAALDAMPARRRSAWRVEGEPGIGKTRLLDRAARAAPRQRGCIVLAGAAAEFERDVPFGVWVDALDAYVASQELDTRRGLGRRAASPSSATILPSLRSVRRRRRRPVADERYRAHRATRRLLELLARTRPLVRRARRPALGRRGVDRAARRAAAPRADAPVLLALAFRPAQAPRAALAAALAMPSVRSGSRSSRSARTQAAQLLGDLDARAAAAIYRQGGGNPFYLEQLARARRAATAGRGARRRAATASPAAGVPAAVAASLAEELASLLAGRARAARRRRRRGRAVRARSRRRHRRARRSPTGLAALDALLALDLVRPTAGAAPLRLPPPARAPGGLRVGAAAAGGSRRTRARPPRSPRAARRRRARAPRRAVGRPGRRGRDRAAARGRRRGARRARPAAAARWFEAALRLLPADRPRAAGRRARRARLGAALARRARALPRRRCSRRSSCCRPMQTRGASS